MCPITEAYILLSALQSIIETLGHRESVALAEGCGLW